MKLTKKYTFNLLLLIISQVAVVSWFFGKNQPARANLLENYRPLPNPMPVAQRQTVGGGYGSSCESNVPPGSITLLVPKQEVVHLTANEHPLLFLHSQIASSLPFKFTLVNPQVDQPLVEKSFSISEPGIKQIKPTFRC